MSILTDDKLALGLQNSFNFPGEAV